MKLASRATTSAGLNEQLNGFLRFYHLNQTIDYAIYVMNAIFKWLPKPVFMYINLHLLAGKA